MKRTQDCLAEVTDKIIRNDMLSQPDIIDLNRRKGYSCNSGMQLSAGKGADQVGTSLRTPLAAERIPSFVVHESIFGYWS